MGGPWSLEGRAWLPECLSSHALGLLKQSDISSPGRGQGQFGVGRGGKGWQLSRGSRDRPQRGTSTAKPTGWQEVREPVSRCLGPRGDGACPRTAGAAVWTQDRADVRAAGQRGCAWSQRTQLLERTTGARVLSVPETLPGLGRRSKRTGGCVGNKLAHL